MFTRETFTVDADAGPTDRLGLDDSKKVTTVFDYLKSLDRQKFYDHMTKQYKNLNDVNEKLNRSRAELIWFSQWMIFIGILLVPTSSVIGFLGTSSDSDVNEPPRANAGSDRTVIENSIVELDGSESYDPDGNLTQGTWQQLCGIPATFDNTIPNPSFTTPSINGVNETLAFGLKVTDNNGATSNDSVVITVLNNETSNVAPAYFHTEKYYNTLATKNPVQNATNGSKQGSVNDSIPDCSEIPLWGYDYGAYSSNRIFSPERINWVSNSH